MKTFFENIMVDVNQQRDRCEEPEELSKHTKRTTKNYYTNYLSNLNSYVINYFEKYRIKRERTLYFEHKRKHTI